MLNEKPWTQTTAEENPGNCFGFLAEISSVYLRSETSIRKRNKKNWHRTFLMKMRKKQLQTRDGIKVTIKKIYSKLFKWKTFMKSCESITWFFNLQNFFVHFLQYLAYNKLLNKIDSTQCASLKRLILSGNFTIRNLIRNMSEETI